MVLLSLAKVSVRSWTLEAGYNLLTKSFYNNRIKKRDKYDGQWVKSSQSGQVLNEPANDKFYELHLICDYCDNICYLLLPWRTPGIISFISFQIEFNELLSDQQRQRRQRQIVRRTRANESPRLASLKTNEKTTKAGERKREREKWMLPAQP